MLKNLPTLDRLIRQLHNVPYLASKNIYKVALYFLDVEEKNLEQLCSLLIEAKKNIKRCVECFNLCEKNETCSICSDNKRDASSICVVETWHDLVAIEKARGFEGVYHVLGGRLSPLEGISPSHLTIDALLKRVTNSYVNELIFATNPTPEGEATASYIATQLKNKPIKISKLASGVPIGSNLEYMDRVTIYKALSNRRPF